jgi:hypothetical protein
MPVSVSSSRHAVSLPRITITVTVLYGFIEIAPSAITELVHWQQQGHALITPTALEKKYTIEEIH